MNIEQWPLAKLRDYDKNPRKNDHAISQMADAIKAFGFRVPVVAKSDGLVVDGHLRLKAARKLKMKTVPVVLADDLTDAQIKAFRISVNKAATWAEWDMTLLSAELADLKLADFDLGLTGFSDIELGGIFAEPNAGMTDPDEVPDAPDDPVSVLGDVWLLGAHRIVCGDSTDAATVAKPVAVEDSEPPISKAMADSSAGVSIRDASTPCRAQFLCSCVGTSGAAVDLNPARPRAKLSPAFSTSARPRSNGPASFGTVFCGGRAIGVNFKCVATTKTGNLGFWFLCRHVTMIAIMRAKVELFRPLLWLSDVMDTPAQAAE